MRDIRQRATFKVTLPNAVKGQEEVPVSKTTEVAQEQVPVSRATEATQERVSVSGTPEIKPTPASRRAEDGQVLFTQTLAAAQFPEITGKQEVIQASELPGAQGPGEAPENAQAQLLPNSAPLVAKPAIRLPATQILQNLPLPRPQQ